MNRYFQHLFPSAICSLLLILSFSALMNGCAKEVQKESVLRNIEEPLHPVKLQVDNLEPGLAVLYFHEFYRNVSQMPTGEKIILKGRKGSPLLQLNHRFAKGVNVFDSGDSTGVGMMLSGYMHLERAGAYTFQVNSNDGIEFYMADRLIISDPGVHKDRLSDKVRITVSEGGWFPVLIKYFQRKGSAALTLYWQPGDAADLSVVPGNVYAHRPQE